ncbi:MAG: restriction endonuclease subunit S [Deltaproteobacteria bacterium]|nr:restriction endonuclease subunit S [Deltaproteobacteria bacterium]MDZ4344422.1 restriction endonuclease subunit S [Candidatus Binatia bacterium]
MSQLRETDVHAETLRRGEQEGGHSCPPNGGLENLPSVGDVAQTELGRLPADWRVGRFDSLFDVQQGRQVSKKNRIGDNQRPFLRTKNVFWNRLDLSDLDEMHFSEADESRLALKPDDLLICEGGDIGRTAIWRGVISRCYYQNHLHRARIRASEAADAQFVLFWLWYAFEFGNLYFGRGNVTTIPNLSQSKLRELPLAIPSLAEQRKIAAVLGLVQRAIEQQERLIALTTELKKALLHKLFTEGLHGEPQKQTEVGPVPESWEQRPLEKAGEVVYGIQAAVASNLKPVGTMILTNKNITLDGKIILEKINYFELQTKRHHETVLQKGDLLFNWRSGSKEHVGKTAYFDLAGEFVHSSFILRIRPSDEVTGRYLFYYLNFLRESGFFLKKQTFSVNAKFNKSAINELPTYLPGEEERRDIVTALDAVGKKLDALQVKRGLLEDLFRTLLHQLMTAQIRVYNLDLPGLEIAQ